MQNNSFPTSPIYSYPLGLFLNSPSAFFRKCFDSTKQKQRTSHSRCRRISIIGRFFFSPPYFFILVWYLLMYSPFLLSSASCLSCVFYFLYFFFLMSIGAHAGAVRSSGACSTSSIRSRCDRGCVPDLVFFIFLLVVIVILCVISAVVY